MYDYNTRKLFQDLYSIFFNTSTKNCIDCLPYILSMPKSNKSRQTNIADGSPVKKKANTSLFKAIQQHLNPTGAINNNESSLSIHTLAEFNTALSYILLFMTISAKVAHLNFSSMYKFFGSKSSLMVKDNHRKAMGVYLEGVS